MSSFISDIVMAGICKKGAFVTVPTENSVLVYSQGLTYICKVLFFYFVACLSAEVIRYWRVRLFVSKSSLL